MMTLIALTAVVALLAGYAYWRRRTALYMPPLPAVLRTDLLYGYYGRDENQCIETAGAVNLAVELRWDGIDATIKRMQRQPLKTVLGVSTECWADSKTPRPPEQAETLLRQTFDALRSAGAIHQVVGFYPIDEPDLWGAADADVTAVCATVRRVAAEYPDLGGSIMACCYANTGRFPGAGAMGWLAIDDYPAGSNMLIGAPMRSLRATMQPGQRLFLVPGGCDPFRESPEAYRRLAHADPLVVAVVPFLWRDYNDPSGKAQQGIRSNGMAPAYRKLGAELVGANR